MACDLNIWFFLDETVFGILDIKPESGMLQTQNSGIPVTLSKVNKWTQARIQSDLHTSNPQFQRKRQKNTIKQPQNEQMASRAGNFFSEWCQLCYPDLTELS